LLIALECPQVFTNPFHNPLDQVKTSVLELDEATVEERRYEEYGEFNELQEVSKNIKNTVKNEPWSALYGSATLGSQLP
jgi:hypothetical protein